MADTIDPLELRRAEVAQYETNIKMYENILKSLPKEWPTHLEKYRQTTDKHKTAAEVESVDDVVLLSQLWYADECAAAIRSETVEMTKAKSILTILEKM